MVFLNWLTLRLIPQRQFMLSIWLGNFRVFSSKGWFLIAMFRADTVKTMQSRAWSTTELQEGLSHLLTDGRLELPDDATQLQEPNTP